MEMAFKAYQDLQLNTNHITQETVVDISSIETAGVIVMDGKLGSIWIHDFLSNLKKHGITIPIVISTTEQKDENLLNDNITSFPFITFVNRKNSVDLSESTANIENHIIPLLRNMYNQQQKTSINTIAHVGNRGQNSDLHEKMKDFKVAPKLLVLGGSTGAPTVLNSILASLDSEPPIPVVIIQHMLEGYTGALARELTRATSKSIIELTNDQKLESGEFYICPGGVHGTLQITANNSIIYRRSRQVIPDHIPKPSVDITLGEIISANIFPIILTVLSGMGDDSYLAARSLRKHNSIIISQDKESSVVWGMPSRIVEENLADFTLNGQEIGHYIQSILQYFYEQGI